MATGSLMCPDCNVPLTGENFNSCPECSYQEIQGPAFAKIISALDEAAEVFESIGNVELATEIDSLASMLSSDEV